MEGRDHRDWKELCEAALEAKNPDEMLLILRELDRVLELEQMWRAMRESSPLKGDLIKQC